ncbi:hypothetical protein [Shewanella surugensis]|uniref:N-acetyltransferase domain-containing protein n=1 Tax=Shewanella surugensis TaxID=212020 RepID=A0ABT0LBJ4_9GAMM|nr:hypothetical protein [Shewanella surugensis]MCL1125071.1 hypothetical protein [Shewanella surugensis]
MLLKISVPFLRFSNKPKNISKVSTLSYQSLSSQSQQKLLDNIYSIYQESSLTLTKVAFRDAFFNTEAVQLCVFYNKTKELVGFINVSTLSIKDVKGKEHAVFCAGVFFKTGYKGGKLAVLFGFSQFLKFKFRHMATPISYVTLVSNPAVYTLLAENAYKLYPVADRPTPEYVKHIFAETANARKISIINQEKSLALSQATPKNISQLERSKKLTSSPFALFFNKMNPHYSKGEAMLVFIELNATAFIVGLSKCIKNLVVGKR